MRSTDTICVSRSEVMRTIQFSVCVTFMAYEMDSPAMPAACCTKVWDYFGEG